jgi:hypothetical protein
MNVSTIKIDIMWRIVKDAKFVKRSLRIERLSGNMSGRNIPISLREQQRNPNASCASKNSIVEGCLRDIDASNDE